MKTHDQILALKRSWVLGCERPKAKKFSKPHYDMLWAEDIPVYSEKDKNGRRTEVTLIAGKIGDVQAPDPAPDSWAADPGNEAGIFSH